MRRAALSLLVLSIGCNKDTGTDGDTDVLDTEVVDTDGETDVTHVPEMDFEIDPDASQTYLASLTIGDKTADAILSPPDGTVAYRVAKLAGYGFFRHYGGSKQVDNPLPQATGKITMAMDVIIPNDNPTTGTHDCVGPDAGYGVAVLFSAGGTAVAGLGSFAMDANDTRPCKIKIQKVDDTHFQATIDEATVVGKIGGKDVEATVTNTTINLRLRAVE